MKMNGKYVLIYDIQKKVDELIVEVQLKMNEDILKPNQNIYFGVVYINDQITEKYDLSKCVDAKLAAHDIGIELKSEILLKCRKERKRLKIIKEK